MSRRVPVVRFSNGGPRPDDDFLAEEAPLEILLEHSFKNQRRSTPWGITLRTPGHDPDLATGLLFSEAHIPSPAAIAEITHLDPDRLLVSLIPDIDIDLARPRAASAACGFCGSPNLPAAEPLEDHGFRLPWPALAQLPAALEAFQLAHQNTGAMHAAALFDSAGRILAVREDVGRHNAVDKLIGWALRQPTLDLQQTGLLLSGRAGFELLHKAARARIPFVAAIGAPTTLSVDLARHANITLAGFLRPAKANVYTGAYRLLP